MKKLILKTPIHKSRRGVVKTFLALLVSLLIFSFNSCGNLSNSNKKPEDNPAVPQQPVDDDTSDDETITQDPPQTNDDDDDVTNNDNNEDEEDDDDDNQPKILTITLGAEYDISSLNNYEKVILAVPQDATSIDVLALAFIHMEINNYYQWQEPDFELEFADYPETAQSFVVDYDAIIQTHNTKYENETPWENNTDVLKAFYQNFNRDKITAADENKTVETEIIPGICIVTFTDYFGTGTYPEVVLNALKVLRATTLKMPSEYSLTGTYKSGVIGDGVNVTLENSANAKVSGEILGYLNFTSVYDLFVKNTDPSALPMIGSNNDKVIFRVSDLDREPYNDGSYDPDNLYGINIDKIIEKYYANDKGSRLSLDLPSETKFDARAYLNGSKMYSGNNYQDNAYPLDINAALIMANARVNNINNVNLTGEKNTELNSLEYLTNVRVSANMSGISIASVSGVVEFMDEAPSEVSGRNSYIVFTKVENNMLVGGLGYVDATALDQSAADRFICRSTYYSLEQFAKKTLQISFIGSAATYDPVTNANDLRMTKEQVEQIGVTGGGLSKTLPNNAKPASKVDLMRNILEDTHPLTVIASAAKQSKYNHA